MEHARTLPHWLATGAVIMVVACGSGRRLGPSPATLAAVEQAEAAEARRDHAVARQRYLEAIAAAPDPPSEGYARKELAETLLHWGELDAGRVQLEAVVALTPGDAAAWHDLGFVRHKLGDTDGAIAALVRSRDLAPADRRPRLTLGVLYWRTGDRARALAEYQALHRLALPERLRAQVEWAIRELSKPAS